MCHTNDILRSIERMKKKFLFFLLLIKGIGFVYSQSLNQQRTLTPSEMIDLFKTKSEVINFTPDLEGFNVVFESETRYPHVLSSSYPLLPMAEFDRCYGEWVNDGDSLYLRRIRGYNALEYEKALIQKYGKGVTGMKGIPATWFTGEIIDYQSPVVFLGDTLTAWRTRIEVNKGKILSRKRISYQKGPGTLIRLGNEQVLAEQTGPIKRAIYSMDGIWSDIYYYSAVGFTRFMNVEYTVNVPAHISQKEEFSILLANDTEGKPLLYLLSPSNPNKNICLLFDLLKEASENLPLWSIDPLETIHGTLIPGAFFRVSYVNQRWEFTNYLNIPYD